MRFRREFVSVAMSVDPKEKMIDKASGEATLARERRGDCG